MPMLKLVDVLAIRSPERERLVEADDAIRDLVRALEAAAEREGQDRRTLSCALVGVLTAAAARQARNAYPSMSQAELAGALADLMEEAVDWASRRVLGPTRGNGRREDAS